MQKLLYTNWSFSQQTRSEDLSNADIFSRPIHRSGDSKREEQNGRPNKQEGSPVSY
jgi:hypothetical protein